MSSSVPVEALDAVLDLVGRPALVLSVTGETLLANAAAASTLGRAPAELAGRPAGEMLAVDDPGAFLDAVRAAADGDGERRARFSSNGGASGDDCRLWPLGTPPAAILLTWRRATPEPAVDGGGIGAVAHSMRQPLQVIYGYAELLAHGILGPLEPRQQQAASRVSQGILELDGALDDLLGRIAGPEP